MLRQSTTENKASTKPGQEDVFTAMSGKMYRRADVENPSRPGFLRDELVPILPDHWAAGSYFDLFTPTHRRMRPLPLTPDPTVISGSETPPELRAELDAAEEARAAWMRRRGELFEAGRQATKRWQLAARQQNAKAYDAALAEELRAAEQLRDIADEEPLLVRRIARANDAIRRWQYLERLRRAEAAAR